MTDITTAGYTNLNIGPFIANNWGFIEFQTSAGIKLIRISKSDPRVTTTVLDSKHVSYSIVLHGYDSDITTKGLPLTFGQTVFKLTDSDVAVPMAIQTFSNATLVLPNDTLTTTISIGILN